MRNELILHFIRYISLLSAQHSRLLFNTLIQSTLLNLSIIRKIRKNTILFSMEGTSTRSSQTKSMMLLVCNVPKLAGFKGDRERRLLFLVVTFDTVSPNIRIFSCSSRLCSPAIDEFDCDVLTIFCKFEFVVIIFICNLIL